MTEKNVLIIGARGHARAVADVIKADNSYRIAGLIDSFQEPGVICFGHKVLGGEEDIPKICDELGILNIFVAIGDNFQRQAMTHRMREAIPDVSFISAIHPSAVLGSDVEIGGGTVVMPRVVIVSGCSISEGCLLNTASSLDHDGKMDAWSSLGPGVIAGGYLSLGERSAIGLGSSVKDRISIGSDTVIGIGSVVTNDVPDKVVAYGVPCRVIRSRRPDEPYM